MGTTWKSSLPLTMARRANDDPALTVMARTQNFLLKDYLKWAHKPCANLKEHQERQGKLREIRQRNEQLDRDINKYMSRE